MSMKFWGNSSAALALPVKVLELTSYLFQVTKSSLKGDPQLSDAPLDLLLRSTHESKHTQFLRSIFGLWQRQQGPVLSDQLLPVPSLVAEAASEPMTFEL